MLAGLGSDIPTFQTGLETHSAVLRCGILFFTKIFQISLGAKSGGLSQKLMALHPMSAIKCHEELFSHRDIAVQLHMYFGKVILIRQQNLYFAWL
jgi:hypothetical protein